MKRVAIGSFGLALVAGALYLGVASLVNARVSCAHSGQPECELNAQTAHEIARTQALGALGCMLAGTGALLWLKASKET
jgi:hypothetical protein